MRNPASKNPHQQSVYVGSEDWEAAREMARLEGSSISKVIVRLIRKEKLKILGKDWAPPVKPC